MTMVYNLGECIGADFNADTNLSVIARDNRANDSEYRLTYIQASPKGARISHNGGANYFDVGADGLYAANKPTQVSGNRGAAN